MTSTMVRHMPQADAGRREAYIRYVVQHLKLLTAETIQLSSGNMAVNTTETRK